MNGPFLNLGVIGVGGEIIQKIKPKESIKTDKNHKNVEK